jgi:formylglycine-generating enzyme required for sulfatase activity
MLSSSSADGFFIGTNYGRHTIVFSNGVYFASRPDHACGYLVWSFGAAYAAWAGLRPMSELEWAKACRGPIKAVPYEFIWGTTSLWEIADASIDVRLTSSENGTEIVTNSDVSVGPAVYGLGYQGRFIRGGDGDPAGNANYVGGVGPLRSGIFATTNGTRVSSAATYWGIIDMAGNVAEPVVTIANSAGRAFLATHGAGSVALPADWPQNDNLGAAGLGAFFSDSPPLGLAIANRNIPWPTNNWPLNWSLTNKIYQYTSPYTIGMRCVRTAPVAAGTAGVATNSYGDARYGVVRGLPRQVPRAAQTAAIPARAANGTDSAFAA